MTGLYLLLVAAALARVCAAIHPAWSDALLHVAGGERPVDLSFS